MEVRTCCDGRSIQVDTQLQVYVTWVPDLDPDHEAAWPSRYKQRQKDKNSPETHLTVAGGIDVPVGDGLDHLGQPAPLSDGLSKRRSRHGDG